ncbi:MAG TPA: PHB depolymerase family esterase [Ideonella sp.]|nr:PHB depolymerase family esterase [Ideonella sp.]
MNKWLGLAALLAVLGSGAEAATIQTLALSRPEGPRRVLLAAPAKAAPGLRPLVILLHGHGGTAAQLFGRERSAAPLSLWLRVADREGWLVAAPDGVKGSDGHPGWNDCRADAANNPHTDDVALVAALIDQLVAQRHADPTRVYVMGMSNGGMMAFRLATELAPRLAGFATIGASMAADSTCAAPTHALPALLVSGTADPLVPYGGGPVRFLSRPSRGEVLGIEQVAARWRMLADLPDEPARRDTLPHRDPKDSTRATRTLWGADPAKPQVELLRIEGGGHVEPSIEQRFQRLYTAVVGAQNGDVEIAEEAFAFFKDKRSAGR